MRTLVMTLRKMMPFQRSTTSLLPGTRNCARPVPRSAVVLRFLVLSCFLISALSLRAEIPTVITDKIYKGSGVIDLMKDVSGAELEQYINTNGGLLLGIDLNDNAAGNETSSSVGMAIKQMEFVLTTSDGVFTFDEFYTSTTALIQEAGAASAQEFHTLFGTMGSNNINGGTSGFDISIFDDVIEMKNVSFTGDILDAQLNVTFLDTANTGVEGNETFFDFSDGFEDFAILTEEDAQLLEEANIGVEAAPETVTFTQPSAPPGAPLPPWPAIAALGFLFLFRNHRHERQP
jgi:hypothetical protein